jgi:hypothetical protein
MSKWEISRRVNPSQLAASWSIVAAVALCFAFPGSGSAQSAEPIHQVIRPVLIAATAMSPSVQSTLLCDVAYSHDEGALPDTSVGVRPANAERSNRSPVVPATIAKSSATPLKPPHKSAFSVEPDYLPSWITDQPLAYLRYGAAPAVATLHFGHK